MSPPQNIFLQTCPIRSIKSAKSIFLQTCRVLTDKTAKTPGRGGGIFCPAMLKVQSPRLSGATRQQQAFPACGICGHCFKLSTWKKCFDADIYRGSPDPYKGAGFSQYLLFPQCTNLTAPKSGTATGGKFRSLNHLLPKVSSSSVTGNHTTGTKCRLPSPMA